MDAPAAPEAGVDAGAGEVARVLVQVSAGDAVPSDDGARGETVVASSSAIIGGPSPALSDANAGPNSPNRTVNSKHQTL